MHKKMFKVVCPMETKDGTTWWMRVGKGYGNKDDSINIYLDALPLGQKEVKLQIRELTEDELRERAEKRATFAARDTLAPSLPTAAPAAAPF